jgi:hypothetical protein
MLALITSTFSQNPDCIYCGINGYSFTDQFGDWVDYHCDDYHDATPIFYRQ